MDLAQLLFKKAPADVNLLDSNHVVCTGEWTVSNIPRLEYKLKKLKPSGVQEIVIDGEKLTALDTAGALLLINLQHRIEKKNLSAKFINFSPEQYALFDLVNSKEKTLTHLPSIPPKDSFFILIGKETVAKIRQVKQYLSFIGQLATTLFHTITHMSALQWRLFLNAIDEMGYRAMPIIALLSFLIGVVLAYQLGFQLKNYGADAFIVNLIGQAVLREFGPLITAIIGAGRSSSAITAQIGTMKINEEIDALRTMGFAPFDILVLPRIIGALIAFPLLMVWADIFGVFGGMVMTKAIFNTDYGDFLHRFKSAIDLTTFLVGLSKAPVFALIIAAVGCFQGMNVSTNADSVGIQTTKSVVQAIFFIIIADAIFSVTYSKLNI